MLGRFTSLRKIRCWFESSPVYFEMKIMSDFKTVFINDMESVPRDRRVFMFFRAPTDYALTGHVVYWEDSCYDKWVNSFHGVNREWNEKLRTWDVTTPKFAVGWIDIPV